MVMFDLPVVDKLDRTLATEFRNRLLDLGFEMTQFSVYMRFCAGSSQAETLCAQVKRALPPRGRVHILQFTDKQYERIQTFRGPAKQDQKNLSLFDLF
jgi:CRISPR-associated protein Cas2